MKSVKDQVWNLDPSANKVTELVSSPVQHQLWLTMGRSLWLGMSLLFIIPVSATIRERAEEGGSICQMK